MFVRASALIVSSATLLAVSAVPAKAQVEGPATVKVVVRAEHKGNAVSSLQPSDLKVEFDGRPVDVTRVQSLGGPNGQPVEVALLIDDSLRGSFGTQLQDISRFVQGLATQQVSVGVGYMRNGHVDFPEGFSREPEQVNKAIRLPLSVAGITGSPYFCLQDLVKHWPTHTSAAHVVLMLTNGIDYYNGSVSPLNQNSPYVDQATTDAQRANVPVYSIYYGRREVSGVLPSLSGQSYLSEVAEGTGGETFNGGQINPPSLTPYFEQFQKALRESYVLSFQTSSRKLERFKVTATNGVKIHAPRQVAAQADRAS